jgi:hypothetical protein
MGAQLTERQTTSAQRIDTSDRWASPTSFVAVIVVQKASAAM